jgi:hypothetical protein
MRKLGPLPEDTSKYLLKFEGSDTLVDTDRARDVAYTEDIIAATEGFALVLDGDILLDDIPTLRAAQDAKGRARIVTSIALEPAAPSVASDGPVFAQVS